MSVTRNKNPIKINSILYGHPLQSLQKAKYTELTIRQAVYISCVESQ